MRKKNDIYLIVALLCIGLIIIIAFLAFSKPGECVVVKRDGVVLQEYSLDSNREIKIDGYAGGELLLHIADGKVWVTDSTCPDKLCEHMGQKDRAGSTIICLPNRISVEISGQSEIDVVVE